MAAANTDLVRNSAPLFATTLANSMLISDTSMTLQSGTGLPTATAITLVIDATDPVSGASTPTLKEVVTGTLSGTTVSNLVRGLDSTTQQGHASGANVTMWITANLWNDFQSSYLAEHTQAGKHTGIQTDTLAASGNATVGGTLGVTGNTTVGGTLGATGAANLSGGATVSTSFTATGLVTFADLVTTIFGGQVQTQANAGTAGGTFSYINLGGIKLCWCIGASQSFGTGGITITYTLPTSFFSTLTNVQLSLINVSGSAASEAAGSTFNTTTITAFNVSGTGTTTGQTALFVIGT